jgi:hypothetical protein
VPSLKSRMESNEREVARLLDLLEKERGLSKSPRRRGRTWRPA